MFNFIDDFNAVLTASGRLDRLFAFDMPAESRGYIKRGLEHAIKHISAGRKDYSLVQAHAADGKYVTLDFTSNQLCSADEDFLGNARLLSIATNPTCFAVVENAVTVSVKIVDTGDPLKPAVEIARDDCVRLSLEWQDTASEWCFDIIRDNEGKLVKLSDRGLHSARNGVPRWPHATEHVYLLPPALVPPEVREAAIDFAANRMGVPIHIHIKTGTAAG